MEIFPGTAPQKKPGGDRKGARDFLRAPKAHYSNTIYIFTSPKKGDQIFSMRGPEPHLGIPWRRP